MASTKQFKHLEAVGVPLGEHTLLATGAKSEGERLKALLLTPGRELVPVDITDSEAQELAGAAIAARFNVAPEEAAQALGQLVEPIMAALQPKQTGAERRLLPSDFTINDGGVFFGSDPPERICSRLDVLAYTRDSGNESWGKLVSFQDPDGRLHQIAIPAEDLRGDGTDVRGRLLDLGLQISQDRKARDRLNAYLALANPSVRKRCVDQIGWQENSFVLPDRVFSPGGAEEVVYQTSGRFDNPYREAGTLAEWQAEIGMLALGNSRLEFAVSLAIAPALMRLTGDESGGFHFRGGTSIGKTTALSAAGSVWGGGGKLGYISRWRATANGLEAVAAAHNDALLVLDELSQVNPVQAGEIAYQLANGQGKQRMTKQIQARGAMTWRLLFLSSGEISLEQHMATVGKQTRGGQQVRMVDIPADAGMGHGLFEALHGEPSARALADRLTEASRKFYGTPIRAFLDLLCSLDRDDVLSLVTPLREDFMRSCCPPDGNGEVQRVCSRFSLVAAAGELAILLDVLPWQPGTATAAAAKCFRAWLDARGGRGSSDMQAAIDQVREFLARNQSRFISLKDAAHMFAPTNQAGYTRLEENAISERGFMIFGEIFRKEVCKGFDHVSVTKELVKRDLLVPAKGKTARRDRIPGGKENEKFSHYLIRPTILDENEDSLKDAGDGGDTGDEGS